LYACVKMRDFYPYCKTGIAECLYLASAAQSLLDEGLRISRQYGLGPEFEEELQAMKKEKLQDADDEDNQSSEWVAQSDNDSDRLRISAT